MNFHIGTVVPEKEAAKRLVSRPRFLIVNTPRRRPGGRGDRIRTPSAITASAAPSRADTQPFGIKPAAVVNAAPAAP